MAETFLVRGEDALLRGPTAEQLWTPSARSAVASAVSSSDTVSSNDEDVHSYDEWELGVEVAGPDQPRDEQEESVLALEWLGSVQSSSSPDQDEGDSVRHENPRSVHEKSDEQTTTTQHDDTARSWGSDTTRASPEWPNDSVDALNDSALDSSRVVMSVDDNDDIRDGRPLSSDDAQSQRTPRTGATDTQATRSVKRSIQVFVRVRPLSSRDYSDSGDDALVVRAGSDATAICVQSSSSHGNNCVMTECSFDHVFLDRSSQEELFAAAEPSLRATLDGYNATVFAYGQTGTGKTHTIFGDDADVGTAVMEPPTEPPTAAAKPAWGIIPRALLLLLDQAETLKGVGVSMSLTLSFIQIYNDKVFDLLTDRRRQRPLSIREQPTLDGSTSVVLQGLLSEPVGTLEEALQLLKRGRANRTVRETELNSSSSRSHAIVQLSITSERSLATGEQLRRQSRLNLVDLAGSEKWNTGVEMEDAHAFELKNINSSLSALGNCIAALSEAGRKHIPYRDSALTRVLQDSFGGNTQACLIATVSPSARASDETLRTLQFADRARSVMQSVRVNEALSSVSELQLAKAQVGKLRDQLEHERRRRHQMRVKEHEAAQRDYANKLQLKEKELQRLARDNAVFARWREDDVKRIRELECRVKELEAVGRLREANGGSATTLSGEGVLSAHSTIAPTLEQRERERRQLLSSSKPVAVTSPTSSVRRFSAKPSPVSSGLRKSDVAAVRPYKQILERYALGSKKSNRSHEESEATENAATRTSLNQSWRSSESLPPDTEAVLLTQPSRRPRVVADQATAPATSSLPEIARGGSVSIPPTIADTSAATDSLSSHLGRWVADARQAGPRSLQLNDVEAPPQAARSSGRHVLSLAHSASSSPLVQSSVPQDATAASFSASTGTSSDARPHWQQVPVALSMKAVARLPEPTAATESTDSKALATYVSLRTPTTASVPSACEKHSLKGCMLCAARDIRVTSLAATLSQPSVPITTTGEPATVVVDRLLPPKARDGPCNRHRLANCFLCSSPSALTSFSTSVSTGTTAPSDVRYPSSFAAALDAKCTVHSLTNCVLCTGATATATTKAPLEAAGRSPDTAVPYFSATGSWLPSRQLEAGVAPHQLSLQRRHSVELGSARLSSTTPSAGLGGHLRTQHSAIELHTQSLAPSFVDASLTATHTPSVGMDSRWQPTTAAVGRSSIHELAFDSNRSSYQTLLREASGAAALALRRR